MLPQNNPNGMPLVIAVTKSVSVISFFFLTIFFFNLVISHVIVQIDLQQLKRYITYSYVFLP